MWMYGRKYIFVLLYSKSLDMQRTLVYYENAVLEMIFTQWM